MPDAAVDRVFAGIAGLIGLALLLLGLGLTFQIDEWNFILLAADPAIRDLVAPFNGHWSALPILSYRLLLEVIGLRTYVPYHALLVVTLLLAAAALYLLARHRAGPWPAVALGVLYLLFGGGHENFWWAFQMGFVGSVAAGLWGLVALDGEVTDRKRSYAVVLFFLGMAASAPGALLLGGAFLSSLARRDLRTAAVLSIPGAVFAVWFVATGPMSLALSGIEPASALPLVPAFMLEGLVRTAGASTGLLGTEVAWATTVAATVTTLTAIRSGWRPSATLIGLAAATFAMFASIALVRGYMGVAGAGSSRYVYAAAPTLAILVAETLPWITRAVRRRGPRARLATSVIAVLAVEFATISSVSLLLESRGQVIVAARQVRAGIELLTGPDGLGCDVEPIVAAPEDAFIARLPDPIQTRRLVGRFGDPRTDTLAPSFVEAPTADDDADARRLLCRP